MEFKEKFIRKYMRLAKQVGEDNNPCHSRKIGVVIVDPVANKILGTGYNGPPRDTPHCDDREYLEQIFWPQLTEEEKKLAIMAALPTTFPPLSPDNQPNPCKLVCDRFANSQTCPRKIIGAPSGKRLELCSCAHAETNAIVNASDNLYGSAMFCWCGVPCFECTKLICNAGIKAVFCIDWGGDYSHGSRWLFQKSGVTIIEHEPAWYLE